MFWDSFIGNELAIGMLRKSLQSKRVASAYLFHGPDGVGKSLAASNFAKGLVCEREEGDGCGVCSSCRRVDSGNHPDVHWYRPVGKMRLVKIEKVRELAAQAALKAFESRWKVFILLEADRMRTEAQNALLKTLEEPPGRSVLILISSNPAGLLPTIVSRCQEICFLPIPREELQDAIAEKWDCEEEEAHLVAALACGSMGSAKRLLDRDNLDRRQALLGLLAEGPERSFRKVRDTVEAIDKQLKLLEKAEQKKEEKRIKAMGRELTGEERAEWESESNALIASMIREDIDDILNVLAFWYRDLLLISLGVSGELVINFDRMEPLRKMATRISATEVLSRLRAVEEARRGIALNLPLHLCLEVLYMSGG